MSLPEVVLKRRAKRVRQDADEAARLAEYVAAIRATARVFDTYHHKVETLAAYDQYIVWIDAWARLSGFGSFVEVDLQVSARTSTVSQQWRLAAQRSLLLALVLFEQFLGARRGVGHLDVCVL